MPHRNATRLALAALLGLSLAGPAAAQAPGGRESAPGGPHGSAAGPIGPQLQAVESSLRNVEQQLSRAQQGRESPNLEQARRAVMAGEDTLAELRRARGQAMPESQALTNAERELTTARQLIERGSGSGGDGSELSTLVGRVRIAANAITQLMADSANMGAGSQLPPASQPAPGGGGQGGAAPGTGR